MQWVVRLRSAGCISTLCVLHVENEAIFLIAHGTPEPDPEAASLSPSHLLRWLATRKRWERGALGAAQMRKWNRDHPSAPTAPQTAQRFLTSLAQWKIISSMGLCVLCWLLSHSRAACPHFAKLGFAAAPQIPTALPLNWVRTQTCVKSCLSLFCFLRPFCD